MSTDLITEHLDLWTSAVIYNNGRGRGSNGKPELTGIAKLRELILELAVRGKLVPQDSEDEPAEKLLERIEAEKERLYKEGEIRKTKKLPEVEEDEKPFEIPEGWEWARLEGLTSYIQRGKSPKYAESGSVKVVSQKCVQWRGFLADPARWVSEDSLSNYQPERFLRKGDVLWNSTGTGTVGRVVSLNESPDPGMVADSHVTVLRFLGRGVAFSEIFLKSPSVQERIDPDYPNALVSGTTKQVELNTSQVKSLPVPVPPIEEQTRIVEKVDELMALCDRLAQQTSDQLSAHETLVDTLLDTLTRSHNAAELADNWARLADHFDTLFTTEHSIDRLEQTILQLAVMGRLVPQDPDEEPASKLLERIAAEKERLYQEGKIKKSKKLPEIVEAEKPFRLPEGWALIRLDDIADIQSGLAKGKKLTGVETVTVPYLRVANVQRAALELKDIKVMEVPRNELDRYLLKDRDLLITEGGDWDKVGRTAIWDGAISTVTHQNHVFRARLLLAEQNERWLEKYLNSQFAREYFARSSKQTTNLASINKTQLRSCTIPIPPLQEQARIIEMINELIALCGRLKSHLHEAGETQRQLAESLVKQAVA